MYAYITKVENQMAQKMKNEKHLGLNRGSWCVSCINLNQDINTELVSCRTLELHLF